MGEGGGWDPCDILIGLSRIPIRDQWSMEAPNCRSDRRETGTQVGKIGKTENHIGYQIRKPVSIFRENRKPNGKKRKIRQPQLTPKLKTEVFWHKNRKLLAQKNNQNRKTENPNAPLIKYCCKLSF